MLSGKRIVIGITGSIAAYKMTILTRLLVKSGAEVKIILTPAARDFVTPLTLATLSQNPVLTEFMMNETGEWNNHVELALWADLILIAPASANTISKMAHGACDNLMMAVYLSARCPVMFAPAMDLDMLQHPSTQNNIKTLVSYGHVLIDADTGLLASGLFGKGRMTEPEDIFFRIKTFFAQNQKLAGKKALVTAGPTHEALDPVRFIGNNSSGKMGYAIAEELAHSGAQVTLVSGPVNLTTHNPSIKLIRVESAEEMFNACQRYFPEAQITVLAAAVADYKPATRADQKIKKSADHLTLELTKTYDIAATLGGMKTLSQLMVGFALETENEVANAEKKITSKNFDLIVLNSLNDKGAGFGHDTNKITLIDRQNGRKEFNLKSKKEVAIDIVNAIIEQTHA